MVTIFTLQLQRSLLRDGKTAISIDREDSRTGVRNPLFGVPISNLRPCPTGNIAYCAPARSFKGNDLLMDTHNRLGHPGIDQTIRAHNLIYKTKLTKDDTFFCNACAIAQLLRSTKPKASRHSVPRGNHTTSADGVGPYKIPDPWECKYGLVILDTYTHYIFFTTHKTRAEYGPQLLWTVKFLNNKHIARLIVRHSKDELAVIVGKEVSLT